MSNSLLHFIMNHKHAIMLGLFAFTSLLGFAQKYQYASFEDYPTPSNDLTELTYSPQQSEFQLWAPTAQKVMLRLYTHGQGGKPFKVLAMKRSSDGTWHASIKGNLKGRFYTFNVQKDGKWLGECPGINAHAVGINGQRGAIIDMRSTDPEQWSNDSAPHRNDIVIYEMHHRDFSISPNSGIEHKGKFLALTETGTQTPGGHLSGIDHLRELGVTHVHILPSYDFVTVDETKPDVPQYNWGYDPLNYNVPEGSYSTNAADPRTRIREFKEMVQALHRNGMRVVLDVVYNHTMDVEGSNFHKTVPGYFHRQRPDGSWGNASGCSNETASERSVMRRYMVESVKYWMQEYHVDGFRFDLMGIHDIETMNLIRQEAQKIDPDVLIYGEGWAAETPLLSAESLAMKTNIHKIPGVAAFSDEIRDALRGPFSDDGQTAFLGGLSGHEESIKFGIVGAIHHPQVDMSLVNYSNTAWAKQPHQLISYVSCHDDMCLSDRLRSSMPDLSEEDIVRLDLLAQTAVFTSQGIPFIQAGEELFRDKKGVHNSYNSPDAINLIDWSRKDTHPEVFNYYKALIQLRNEHPAFRMLNADLVRSHLEFIPAGDCLIAFHLKDHAAGDVWKDIIVVLNGNNSPQKISIPTGNYELVAHDARINLNGLGLVSGSSVTVAPRSATILYSK